MCPVINIFIIDDDPTFVFLSRKIIASTGFETSITEFGDGQQAVDHLSDPQVVVLPDIILLDLNMPVLDGWGFLDDFKLIAPQLQKDIKLFIVSSSISPHDVQNSKNYAIVSDFLVKPLQRMRMIEIFESQLFIT